MLHRVSSNWTLFLKIFLPTVWIVFFGCLFIGIWFIGSEDFALFNNVNFKIGYSVSFIVFLAFLYFTVMSLKRVEMSIENFQVTNYFNTYSYKYIDIEKIVEQDYFLFTIIKIKLKSKGSLGKNLTFLANKFRYKLFLKEHPDLFQHLL